MPLGVLLGVLESSSGLDGAASSLTIEGADELLTAGPAELALAAHKDYVEDLRLTGAGAVIVSAALRDAVPTGCVAVVVERPHEVFAGLLAQLYPAGTRGGIGGVSPSARAALLEEGVVLGPNVVIGHNVEIGRNTVIGGNTVIGNGVTIGRNCTIASNCTIDCAYIGNNVVIQSGVRVGTEGFGWLDFGTSNRKIPQLGRVIVQEDVEIGANTTIDRGALGDTVIGQGTKIDNLVQIGHNCRIGRYCLIAGQSGLSGSTIVEDGVLFGGNAATSGHITIGARSIVRARAGVMSDVPPGSDVAGAPAQNIRDFWRELATLRRLSKGKQR